MGLASRETGPRDPSSGHLDWKPGDLAVSRAPGRSITACARATLEGASSCARGDVGDARLFVDRLDPIHGRLQVQPVRLNTALLRRISCATLAPSSLPMADRIAAIGTKRAAAMSFVCSRRR